MTTTQPLSALTMLLSRHTRRREFFALLAGIAWPRGVMAQKAEKTRRIVMLTGIAEADPEGQARVAALQEGWVAVTSARSSLLSLSPLSDSVPNSARDPSPGALTAGVSS